MTLNSRYLNLTIICVAFFATSCAQARYKLDIKNKLAPVEQVRSANDQLIQAQFAPKELTQKCAAAITTFQNLVAQIVSTKPQDRNLQNTLLKLEESSANFSDVSQPLTFMGYVSTDKAIRDEASDCEVKVGQVYVETFMNKALYEAIKDAKTSNDAEARLLHETKRAFEHNGLDLPKDQFDHLKDLKNQLTALESKFSENLNEDVTSVELSKEELTGLPDDFIAKQKLTESGKLIVSTKSTDYSMVMENAISADARKKMMAAYNQKGMSVTQGEKTNKELLEQAVKIRKEIAKILNVKNWADYRIDGRMAKDSQTVLNFLNGLKDKLAQKNQDDIAKLFMYKKEVDPKATQVDAWDINYLSYQIKKRDFELDTEKIREYFPKDVVMSGLFEVYSKLLGVTFKEVQNAKVWHPSVKLYEVHDKKDDAVIAFFFTDLFPREGKYGHAAAFPLISGRDLQQDGYAKPIAAIVANLAAPSAEKPSLLDHEEVETVFHEFGHIMHGILTRASFASLSGTSVAQDFVEAPSQMLENWVWTPKILKTLSSHYKTGEKLPDNILEKMMAAKQHNIGYYYTRQLMLALYDMSLHTSEEDLDSSTLYNQLYQQLIGVTPITGGNFAAGFGHLMGGYDAGYYGYLWSEVYAQDMFSKFEETDVLSEEIGSRYRKIILEQGNLKEPLDLVEEFLGRKVDFSAFYHKLGIHQ